MEKQKQSQNIFPPVVTVVGHVDHGKTTLLDTIRKTAVAEREHGGITQRIGASRIEISHDGKKRGITFIDTPGHAAFGLMRGRGIQAADMGILVVSAVDGVMPQTKESIQLLKDTNTPFIVAITKVDLPEKQVEKVKQQLLKEDVLLEGLGGDVPFIEVSAKTGKNISELLDLIVLAFDMHEGTKKDTKALLEAIVIESKKDQKSGPKATLVIKQGTLSVRDEVESDQVLGKVRAIVDFSGKQVPSATIGDAVEVLGFADVPQVGSLVTVKQTQPKVQEVEQKTEEKQPFSQADFFAKHVEKNEIPLIVVADTLGSLEAILLSLPKEVRIVLQKTGEISEADVLLAKSTGAIIVGFNTRMRNEVIHLAGTEKVLMKNYTIIYELLDEIQDAVEGKALSLEEKIFGKAKILASFPFEKTKVCGIAVLEGRVAKGDKARIMRGEEVIGEATIASVRQGKNQTSKVEKGQEAGIIISPLLDFTIGDMVICHG